MLSLDLKSVLQLPDAEGALGLLAVAVLASMGVFGLQGFAWFAVTANLQRGDVAFPLALQEGASFGSPLNLLGWGFHVNAAPQLLAATDALFGIALLVLVSKLLGYMPILLLAGIGAKQIELHVTGTVLNWIVVPTGGDCVKIISLGDVAMLLGMAGIWVVMTVRVIAAIRLVMAEIRRARAAPAPEHPPG